MAKFYITTAIFYTNAKPHIGHTLDVVQADVLARYHRLKGKETFFLTGTDEHGTKIVRSAQKNNKPIRQWVDENALAFKKVVERLNVSFDDFIRTSDRKKHWPAAQEIWRRIEKSGDIYKKKYKGLYCVGHEAFVTGKDLVNGLCPDHQTQPEIVEEENYFFRLSKYQKEIERLIESDEYKIVPESRKNEVLSFIRQGLEDVSFSRPAEALSNWGIPVPGSENHLMYVWADALTNYLSGIDYFSNKEKAEYWPADVHVVGKDILRFHAVIWPAMLISAGISSPKSLLVHGFINLMGEKISKTVGNVIDPLDYINEFGADAVRYYLLAEVPTTEDSDFTRERFIKRYNADLADGLGNLTARILALASDWKSRETKEPEGLQRTWSRYEEAFERLDLRAAVGEIWQFIHSLDSYIVDKKPWQSKDREVIGTLLQGLANISWLIRPFLPDTAEKIAGALGIAGKEKWEFKPQKIDSLFPKYNK